MYPFFESISLRNGRLENLEMHQARINRTFHFFYPDHNPHTLSAELDTKTFALTGHYKLKFLYNENSHQFEQTKYQSKLLHKIYLVPCNSLNYTYKYSDRQSFNYLKKGLPSDTEIIILKNNFLTDATNANLVFYDGSKWFTPSHCLLEGTMRAVLLQQKKIQEIEIRLQDLTRFEKFALINAMNPLEQTHIYPIQLITKQ
ncbi:MAG: aminotransferase class IV [Saprospiraceae bacterium]|nr:aminotransferase class IV [Saprospiraceae bacterium]